MIYDCIFNNATNLGKIRLLGNWQTFQSVISVRGAMRAELYSSSL